MVKHDESFGGTMNPWRMPTTRNSAYFYLIKYIHIPLHKHQNNQYLCELSFTKTIPKFFEFMDT